MKKMLFGINMNEICKAFKFEICVSERKTIITLRVMETEDNHQNNKNKRLATLARCCVICQDNDP